MSCLSALPAASGKAFVAAGSVVARGIFHTAARRIGVFLALLLCGSVWTAHPVSGADAVLDSLFDPADAVEPRPGDWFDYLVAYPVDPLENSLRPEPLPAPQSDDTPTLEDLPPDEEYYFFVPNFEADAAWKTVPLRLELREIDADGINAIVTFAGKSHPTRLVRPDRTVERPDFPFAPPQPEPERRSVTVGAATLTVDVVHRIHDEYGFVRWTSPDVPFGLVRFAGENLDIVLIDYGRGTPPDFPQTARAAPSPPLGALYGAE
ncbi:MAG: hypothetical protein LUG50_14395 [Planctomycetaceae bacterium]|nr:hypothetical protein [Planctomycetaceae bacterium]